MASEALRRLAARVSDATATPVTSDITQFEGSRGSGGSTTPNPLENIDFLGVSPGTTDANLTGSGGSSRLDIGSSRTPGTPEKSFGGSTPEGKKSTYFQGLTGTGTPGTLGTHENDWGGSGSENAARPAAIPEPPTQPDEPGLSFYSIRERDRWYEEQRNRRTGLDQDPLACNLIQRLAEPGLSEYTIRDLANWYEEEGNRRRVGNNLDQGALDRDLRRLLAERGVFPEFIAVEFERVMQVVFPGTTATLPSKPGDRPTWSADADDLRVEHIAAQLEEAEQERLTDDWLED